MKKGEIYKTEKVDFPTSHTQGVLMKTLNIGFNNFVIDEHVISIVVPDTAPARRLREDAKNRDVLIDATAGRKTRSIIIMDNGFVVLSAVNVETLIQRIEQNEK